ncbi:MAG: diphthamide synthesis protein, partial [Candidatus Aenigmatarchaeota archaeon]
KKVNSNVPVVYVDWNFDIKIDDNIKNEIKKLKEQRIGLICSVQYLDSLSILEEKLKESGKTVVIGGHVLGCWYENINKIENLVDCFVFVGSGEFHPLGIRSAKPLYFLDIENDQLREMSDDIMKQEKIRLGKIMKAKDAGSFGILVSSKSGQFDMKNAEYAKKELERKDKKAFILIMDEIENENMIGMGFDAFINTACPRIIYDKFDKPILNVDDIAELFE